MFEGHSTVNNGHLFIKQGFLLGMRSISKEKKMKNFTAAAIGILFIATFLAGKSSAEFTGKFLVALLHRKCSLCNGILATVRSAIVPDDCSRDLDTSRNEVEIRTIQYRTVDSAELIVHEILSVAPQEPVGEKPQNLAVAFLKPGLKVFADYFGESNENSMIHITEFGFKMDSLLYVLDRWTDSYNGKDDDLVAVPLMPERYENSEIVFGSKNHEKYSKMIHGSPVMNGGYVVAMASVYSEEGLIYCTRIDKTVKAFIIANQDIHLASRDPQPALRRRRP